MIIQFLGRHGEVLKTVKPPAFYESISIREEHFPERPFADWDPKKKVIDLSKPPSEVR